MGYFIAFKVMELKIKSEVVSEIKLGIKTDVETILVIDKKELSLIEWNESGKEMKYKGSLYDVVKTEENKDATTFYCINDKQEDALFANLDEHINSHIVTAKSEKNNSTHNLVNDVVKLFYQNKFQFNFNTIISTISFYQNKEDYISKKIKTNSPPPEFV